MMAPSFALLAVGLLASSVSASLESCLVSAGIPITLPGNATWDSDISPWQLRIRPVPAAVIDPTTHAQVAAGVACARANNVKVAARNGGHSYGSYGVGGISGALVIDMQAFQSVSYDSATTYLTFGGGSYVSDVVTWLWKNHGRHFPHVRANRVGLAGSSIGGGFGSTSRFLGTPMDYLVSVKYLLANGQIVTATRSSNADLFWAAQGAGSSFGILLSLTTRTWAPVHANATSFQIALPTDSSLDTGVKALLSIQDFFFKEGGPDEFSIRWQLTAPPFSGSGFYYGDPAEFDSAIAPLLAKFPANTNLTKTVTDFWAIENIATPQIESQIDTFPPRNFYLQALVLRTDQPFTYESAFKLYNSTTYAFNRTDLTKFGFIDLWGGISRNIKDTDTSFAHANSGWLIRWEGRLAAGLTTFPADGIPYLRAQMKPFEDQLAAEKIPIRGFVNYRDTELTTPEWSSRLYANNWSKLLKIKKNRDPLGLFTTNPQSIPLS